MILDALYTYQIAIPIYVSMTWQYLPCGLEKNGIGTDTCNAIIIVHIVILQQVGSHRM